MPLSVTSSAFEEGGMIPSRFTCEGNNTSPPLSWSGVPSETKTFALIVDDPDAPDPEKPQRVYVHWVAYNIPGNTTDLQEDASRKGLPGNAPQGRNDWDKRQFGGPCPPIGRHRYFHKIYALDTELGFVAPPTKNDLLKEMKGHVLASGELMGTYQKGDPK